MAHAPEIDAAMRVETQARELDALIAELAERQDGVVARWQLLGAGAGSQAISRRIARRLLHPLYRGVYAVGHTRLASQARLTAAFLAAGAEATVSHRSAGASWDIRAWSGLPELTVPWTRRRSGLLLHEARLPADERARRGALHLTTAARTLLDLAAVLGEHELARALDRAESLGLGDRPSLPALLDRYPRRPGSRALRKLVRERRIGEATRSELEEHFLAFVSQSGLEAPRVNHWISLGGRMLQLDSYWPEQGLVVELDGFASHGTRESFERDRARDRLLNAAGLRVIRVTWRHLHHDAARLRSDLRLLLSRYVRGGSPLSTASSSAMPMPSPANSIVRTGPV